MRTVYRKVSIPEHCHPLVTNLFLEMRRQCLGVVDMADKSGVNKNTLKDWRTRTMPRIADLEACYNVLGLELVARQMTNAGLDK